jgi:hypothetical protein
MNDKKNKRSDGGEFHETFELTPDEKKALDALPRDRMPSAALEDRVVDALRNSGLLAQRRVIELTKGRIAAAVAACIVLLISAFALGQWAGARQIAGDDIIVPEAGEISVALTLQQAGSAYVLALQRFAAMPDSINGNQAVQGREVALTTLYTAADQVTRLVPKNELARQLLAAIDADPGLVMYEVSDVHGGTRVIEF